MWPALKTLAFSIYIGGITLKYNIQSIECADYADVRQTANNINHPAEKYKLIPTLKVQSADTLEEEESCTKPHGSLWKSQSTRLPMIHLKHDNNSGYY